MKNLSILFFIFSFTTQFVHSQCTPTLITATDVSKAVVLIELRDNTTNESVYCVGTLINNQNEDGRNLVLTSNFHYDATNCGNIYQSNEHYFHWENGEVTRFATKLEQNDNFVLLELGQEPPYDEITYLGLEVPTFGLDADLITFYDDGTTMFQTELITDEYELGDFEYNCDNNNVATYQWSTSNQYPNLGVMITEWMDGEGNVNTDSPTKGAPLINSSNKVEYTYITRFQENICHQDDAIFTDIAGFIPIDVYGSIGSRSIKIKKCPNTITVSQPITNDISFKAEYIIAESEILNTEVVLTASNQIILRPGFTSGNNLHAKLGPCNDEISLISLKSEEVDKRSLSSLSDNILISPNPSTGLFVISTTSSISSIQVYNSEGHIIKPISNYMENQVQIDLNIYPAGMYYVYIRQDNQVTYHKIIKQ
jgi:hypothetical protein